MQEKSVLVSRDLASLSFLSSGLLSWLCLKIGKTKMHYLLLLISLFLPVNTRLLALVNKALPIRLDVWLRPFG